jgi:hypothetical protein
MAVKVAGKTDRHHDRRPLLTIALAMAPLSK